MLDERFKSSPFQGGNHGFESRTRYKVRWGVEDTHYNKKSPLELEQAWSLRAPEERQSSVRFREVPLVVNRADFGFFLYLSI